MKRKLAKLMVTVAAATFMIGSTVMVASAEESGCYYYDYESGDMIWCGGGYDGAYDGAYCNGYYCDGYHDGDCYYDNGYHHDDNSHHESSSSHHGGSSHHSGHH